MQINSAGNHRNELSPQNTKNKKTFLILSLETHVTSLNIELNFSFTLAFTKIRNKEMKLVEKRPSSLLKSALNCRF
jgi:hypothetical protein